MMKAGRPSVTEAARFMKAWDDAAPIVKDIPNNAIKTVGDFEDALHDKANQVWQNDVQPLIDKHKAELVDGNPIRDNIRNAITGPMTKYDQEGASAINQKADEFHNKKVSVGELNDDLQYLNAKLKKYYRAAPGDELGL